MKTKCDECGKQIHWEFTVGKNVETGQDLYDGDDVTGPGELVRAVENFKTHCIDCAKKKHTNCH